MKLEILIRLEGNANEETGWQIPELLHVYRQTMLFNPPNATPESAVANLTAKLGEDIDAAIKEAHEQIGKLADQLYAEQAAQQGDGDAGEQ